MSEGAEPKTKAGKVGLMGFESWRKAVPPPALRLLGREVTGTVSWNMNDTCNYRCSYCTQRFNPDRSGHLDDAAIARHIRAFTTLPGCWEVKLSGGEPFRQPGLVDIARGLVAHGHIVSIQTNFSAPERQLLAFLEATTGSLHVFAASLHLEYATVAEFIARQKLLEPWVRDHGLSFCVTSVATPARLRELHDEVAPAFREAGIRFKVQPEKVHGVVRSYSDDEQRLLLALGGHNGLGDIAPDFQGRLCWAGSRYLIVKTSGEAFRCCAASRVGGKWARVGSIDEGFDLRDGPRACAYTHCNCTVPIERGMIAGVSPRGLSHLDEEV
ncbi:MAG TPA: radical SAM protein [Myxococcota bacterium]|nr:radical SAM protein [Myxococcota bacterium]